MYKDFREMQLENDYNSLRDAVWVCTVKDEVRFTVDLIYYKEYKAVALIHVGKDGYKNDLFYECGLFYLAKLLPEQIDDTATKMIDDIKE